MTLGLDTGVRKTKRKTINIEISKKQNQEIKDDKKNGCLKYYFNLKSLDFFNFADKEEFEERSL